jgi:hypothetical protein
MSTGFSPPPLLAGPILRKVTGDDGQRMGARANRANWAL